MTILSQALIKQAVTAQAEAIASVDPRVAEYYRLLRIYIANTGGGNLFDWEEAQYSNPTGVFYESPITVFKE